MTTVIHSKTSTATWKKNENEKRQLVQSVKCQHEEMLVDGRNLEIAQNTAYRVCHHGYSSFATAKIVRLKHNICRCRWRHSSGN